MCVSLKAWFYLACMVLFLCIVADIRRPVDDISERSSDTTEIDRERSELSMSESFEITSDDGVKDGVKLAESEDDEEEESLEEKNEEEKEIMEAVQMVRIKSPNEGEKAQMKAISKEERTRSFELLTDIMAESLPVAIDKSESDSSDSEDTEEKDEDTITDSRTEPADVQIDLERLEKIKDEKVETVETVVIETIEKPPLEQADVKETGMEVTKFVQEPESVTETETETEDERKDGRRVTEYQEEEYMEGEVKVTKKTVSHSSHTSTVVKGTPKITETVTLIQEMVGPETLESASKGRKIQQFTTTVSGVEAEEKMAKLNRFKVEGKRER